MTTVKAVVRKVGERQFIAGVKLNGSWIFSEPKDEITAGQARGAVQRLNKKLQQMKAGVVLDSEFQLLEPARQKAQVFRAAPHISSEIPEEFSNLPKTAATENGWTTPRSDKEAWIESYENAVEAVTGTKLENLKLKFEENLQFRKDVTVVMRATGFIGPWNLNEKEIPWIYVAGCKDPTSMGVRPGTGDRRVMKDINGIKRINGGEQVQEKSVFAESSRPNRVQVFGGTKTGRVVTKGEVESSEPEVAGENVPAFRAPRYTHGSPAQRQMANMKGQELAVQAGELGKDEETVKLWGKIGYCLSLRAQGLPPHVDFEREIKAAGVTEKWLQEKSGRTRVA